MPMYRNQLPQTNGDVFLTDGGTETSLIYDYGVDLPLFAAYPLVEAESGREVLRRYLAPYLDTARTFGTGFVLETPTWRASSDWGALLGHDADDLAAINRQAVEQALRTRDEADLSRPLVISGLIGPRGDGYVADATMTADEARDYHRVQVDTFADTEADMVCSVTLTTAAEATGIALAAKQAGMPVALGFTVETDGRLPSGQTLADAVTAVDAATDDWPAYYLVNCAHPTHFEHALEPGSGWTRRIGGVRANASTKSHAELDEATELDSGDIDDLASRYAALRRSHPQISVLGGCCGTDHRHVAAIAQAVAIG